VTPCLSSKSSLSKARTLTDELKPEDIKRLHAALRPPLRERYDFATTMNRWALEIRACDDDTEPVLSEDGTDWDALASEILEPDPDVPKTERRRKKPGPTPTPHRQTIRRALAWRDLP
jgi:hypothetical protein